MVLETDSRPTIPMLPVLLLQYGYLAAVIALRPPWPIRLAAFAVYTVSLGLVLSCTTGDLQRNYSFGCSLMGQLFTAVHLLWLSDPLKEVRHERDYVAPAELPLWRRMYWAMCVFHSPRGIGWSYEITNVPSRPSEPRWKFVRRQLVAAFRWYILVDLAQAYQRANPLFSQHGADLFSISSQGYVNRCVNIVARYMPSFALIAMQYCLLAALFVACGWSLPREWPKVYGDWADAYTVRRFWGRTYHQLIRRYTASFGKACCRVLGLQPGSWASSHTQLYVGFAVSGLMHCGGDYMVRPALLGASFAFFAAQAVAISLEDAVIGAAKRTGVQARCPELLAHCLGYAWVFVWLSISAPWYLSWAMKAGVIDLARVPFSLVTVIVPGIGASAARFASILPLALKTHISQAEIL